MEENQRHVELPVSVEEEGSRREGARGVETRWIVNLRGLVKRCHFEFLLQLGHATRRHAGSKFETLTTTMNKPYAINWVQWLTWYEYAPNKKNHVHSRQT